MSAVREPAAAGRFYPASPGVLLRTVDRLLAEAEATPQAGELRALVVPHAGYDYSGAVAASAFAAVPRSVLRVALLGPSHFVPLQRPAVSTARAWRTPLGVVPVDRELRDAAVASGAVEDERPHRYDHALEVELPFLQRRSGTGLRILPVAAGGGTRPIASVVAAVSADALIVVSSDLSHGLDDAAARARDQRTADAIATLDDAAIDDGAACGAPALRGLLAHARQAGWVCTPLDLRTSADATGSSERVVGYGAFAFTETSVPRRGGLRR